MRNFLAFFILVISVSLSAIADSTEMAKQVLMQNKTNTYCSAGNNGANEEQYEQYQKDQFEGCSNGSMTYVECLRKSWNEAK